MRDRLNLSLPVEMIDQIAELAIRKRLTRSAIVEAAVASFLSPDGVGRLEAAFVRRLGHEGLRWLTPAIWAPPRRRIRARLPAGLFCGTEQS